MTRIYPGDLIAVFSNGRYYYALILDKVRFFGGNWVYVLHETSLELLSPDQVLATQCSGFHALVDFIWAKREGRLLRVATKIDVEPYNSVRRLKDTHHFTGKAPLWFIYDMDFQEVKRVAELDEEEKAYPLLVRIDDTIMAEWVEQQWEPDKDQRI